MNLRSLAAWCELFDYARASHHQGSGLSDLAPWAVNLVEARVFEACRARGIAMMGILNLTPDSFFDGGLPATPGAVRQRLEHLVESGADLVDIGGESSRPGAKPVPAREQIARIGAAVEMAVARRLLVSVDTTCPEVAEAMLRRGARIVNDVSCLSDPGLAEVAARADATLILMHTRGSLGSMAGYSEYPDDAYQDIIEEIANEWVAARDRALAVGMPADRVWLDPGLGFAKNARQSLEVLARLGELGRCGTRVVVGPGRKSFISSVDPSPPERRLGGTIGASILCWQRGASVLRVHDVQEVRQAILIARAASVQQGGLGA